MQSIYNQLANAVTWFYFFSGFFLTVASVFLGFALCIVGFISLFVSGFVVLVVIGVTSTNNFVQYFRKISKYSVMPSAKPVIRSVEKEE